MAGKNVMLLKNATIATEQGVFGGSVVIENGKIAAILEPGATAGADRVMDCSGLLVLPGVVDAHVHANDPGNTGRENFTTLTMAAAAGGITTIVDMPVDTVPPPINASSYANKRANAEKRCLVDFALWGGMIDDNLAALPELARAGAAGFKAFMIDAGPEYPHCGPDVLRRGMAVSAGLDMPVLVHAEDEQLCAEGEKQCRMEGRNRPEDFLSVHTIAAENIAIGKALALAEETGCQIHICHASNPEAVRQVVRGKARGLRTSVETCMHYLFFTATDALNHMDRLKCAPPLRSRADVEGLWAQLLAGDIDVIASDHSPSQPVERAAALSIWDVWSGIDSIQATLPLLFSEGVMRRGLSLPLLVRMVSANPARLAGLFPRKGDIRAGGDADLVLVNPAGAWRWDAGNWLTKHGCSPYISYSGSGAVVATLVRGACVFADKRIMIEPGYGRYQARIGTGGTV